MLRGKTAGVRFFVTDDVSNETYNPSLRGVINAEQANRFARDPEMILQFAHYLAKEHRARTGRSPRVQALVLTSLNGRKPQLFIDPIVDLASEPKYSRNRLWILPLEQPLRESPWKVPLRESVSGPKMYNLSPSRIMQRVAEDTQLYQIIHIDGDQLHYEARTATGDLYDGFVLEKQPGKANRMTEISPEVPERRRQTLERKKDTAGGPQVSEK